MIKAVIFDLDGVLVSTDELHYKAWKQLAEDLGITKFTKEDNKLQKGVSRMASLEVVLAKGDKVYTQEEKEEFAERKNNYYKEMLKDLSREDVLPGAFKTLEYLHENNILVGVGSVSKNTPLILERTGLDQYIDKVSCGNDITKSKPDPEVFFVAADKLGIPATNCLVVEDSASGIQAAKAAGMASLGVGPEHNQLGADNNAISLDSMIDWNELLQME